MLNIVHILTSRFTALYKGVAVANALMLKCPPKKFKIHLK